MDDIRSHFVDEVIDAQPLTRFQASTIGLCCLVAVLDGFDAQVIGFLAPSIAASLQIDLRSFGPMFSAGLFGLMIGTLVMGPLGDRWGRKWILIASMVMFGVMSGLTAYVETLNQLVAARFLTGLGLGGALPSIIALVTEYAPRRLNRIPASLISAAVPAGGLLAGLIASRYLEDWGWRGMFLLGAALPLAVAVVLAVLLPESIRFLSLSPGAQPRVRAIMARVWRESADMNVRFFSTRQNTLQRTSIAELFKGGRARATVCLWVAYFMNLLVLYFVVSWMPTLLRGAGMPISVGIMAISAFSLGGIIGSVAQGLLMNRFPPVAVMLAEFAVFIGLTVSLTLLPLSYALIAAVTFLMGCAVQGAQAGLNIFSATFYPTSIRSTGIGWGLGIGRIGSIVGPLLGGFALTSGWDPRQIFLAGAAPALAASAAIILSGAWGRSPTGLTRPLAELEP